MQVANDGAKLWSLGAGIPLLSHATTGKTQPIIPDKHRQIRLLCGEGCSEKLEFKTD